MSATVREIAKSANVSIATVSRALRNAPGVSADVAAVVRATAETLQYSRPRARAVWRKSSSPLTGRAVALLLLGTEESLASLPVIASALHGVESAVAAAGGAMVLADCRDLDQVPAALETQRIAGVVLKGAIQGDALARSGGKLLARLKRMPSVWLMGRPLGCEWGDAVGTDNPAVGRLAAEFLLSRGHKHVAFMSSVVQHPLIDQRHAAFVTTIVRAGGRVESIVADDSAHPSLPERRTQPGDGDALVTRFLALLPRPTAIFSAYDHLSAIVHRGLASRGVAVGRDVEIISCNNERSLIESLNPPLATFDTNAHAIGRKAVELLSYRLDHPGDANAVTWSLQPKLFQP